MNNGLWTPEEEKTLIELCKKKMVSRDIGVILNKSRNSVIAKADRMGIVLPFKHGKKPSDKKISPPKKRKIYSESSKSFDMTDYAIPLLEVKEYQCRWPFGENAMFCCGKDITRRSYCEEHAEVAYSSAPKRTVYVEYGKNK